VSGAGGPEDRGGPGGSEEGDGASGPGPGRSRRVRQGERPARHRKVNVRRRRVVAGIFGAVVVVVAAFTLWYELESHALGGPGQQVVVGVTAGESVHTVVARLSADKVIGSSLAFEVSDLIHGSPTVTPGDYLLHQNLTFGQVRAILNGGPNVFAVTVLPGLTLAEVASRVDGLPGHDNASFAKTVSSGVVRSAFSLPGSTNLEGMLGTGTYLVLPGESDTTILTDMVTRFDADAARAGLTAAAATTLGVTPYQLITVASVVEKEGYIAANMPDVSRVIYNRLANDMPLQMDSTVLYALGQDGGPVTPQDEQIQSPYNSYLNKGLPPTPICSVSVTAMAAAAHPPPGDWLYFELVQKDGTEAFSHTYAEQLANEKLAQSRGIG
jgi:UPF0755 protein